MPDLYRFRALEDAILAIAGKCDGAINRDGAGFDGRDSVIGRSFADQILGWRSNDQKRRRFPEGSLSPRQREVACKMVHKYRKQLASQGIDAEVVLTLASSPATPAQMAPVGPERAAQAPAATGPIPVASPGLQSRSVPISEVLAHPTRSLSARDYLPPGPTATRPDEITVRLLVDVIQGKLPGYEQRPQQMMFMELLERTLHGDADYPDLIAEMGTGTGKSLALMIPHLATAAKSRQPAIIATTTKSLQRQYRRDVTNLQEWVGEIRPFTSAEVKGRKNFLCLKLYDDKCLELEATGEVGFATQAAAIQFVEQVRPLVREQEREHGMGDLEDAPFKLEPAGRAELTVNREGCAGKNCPRYTDCFANRALGQAREADFVITNTRMLIEHLRILDETDGFAGAIPVGLRSRDGGEIDGQKPRIFLDEAHGLEDVAREAFGVEMTVGRFYHVADSVLHFTIGHKIIRQFLKRVKSGQRHLDETDQRKMEAMIESAERWQERCELLGRAAGTAFHQWLKGLREQKVSSRRLGDEYPIGQPLLDVLSAFEKDVRASRPIWLDETDTVMWEKLQGQVTALLLEYKRVLDPGDPDITIRFIESEKDEESGSERAVLKAQPINVAPILNCVLWSQFPNVVAVSATLAGPDGLDHWRHRVGAPDTGEMVVPAPFNYAAQSLMYLPPNGNALDPRGEARNPNTVAGRGWLAQMLELAEQGIRASGGGAFVLFTSKRDLNNALNGAPEMWVGEDFLPAVPGLRARLGEMELLVQGELPQPELTARFKEHGNAVLLGLKTYWEGVDVAGEALRLVIIWTFPFAPPDDPVWNALCDFITRQGGSWFDELALVRATIALKQGTGRLIRHKTDFGVMMILDGRATTARYRNRILQALPPATRTYSMDSVRAFFQSRLER